MPPTIITTGYRCQTSWLCPQSRDRVLGSASRYQPPRRPGGAGCGIDPSSCQNEWDVLVTAGLGTLIVILEGLQQLYQYHSNWISDRSTCEALKHEKFLYLGKAGIYAAANDPMPYWLSGSNPWFPRNTRNGRPLRSKAKSPGIARASKSFDVVGPRERARWPEGLLSPATRPAFPHFGSLSFALGPKSQRPNDAAGSTRTESDRPPEVF